MKLLSEIHEQAALFAKLAPVHHETCQKIKEVLATYNYSYIYVAARGSSDNAARYMQYLFGSENKIPVALATPSLFTIYYQVPHLQNALVVGISQSGQSPDIVTILKKAKEQHIPSIAITNDTQSPLAQASLCTYGLNVGHEFSIAATKTYTGQLFAIAMLSAVMLNDARKIDILQHLDNRASVYLSFEEEMKFLAQRFSKKKALFVLGRGLHFSTAYEFSLKAKELTYMHSYAYSMADLMHGPIASISNDSLVIGIINHEQEKNDFQTIYEKVKNRKNISFLTFSQTDFSLGNSHYSVTFPGETPYWCNPILWILPLQLFCYHLSKSRGINPDKPRGLQKITETT